MHTLNRNMAAILAATLALAASAGAQERVIEQGKTFGDLSGNEGQLTLLRLDVPGGLDGMVIEVWGGQGNLDLFVRHGKVPDGKHFDYQSASPTNTERAVIPNPADGTWYIGLYARASFTGASIRVTIRGLEAVEPPVPTPAPQPAPAQTQPAQVAPPPVASQPVQVPAPMVAPPASVTPGPTSQPPAPEPAIGPPSPRMPSVPQPAVTPPPPPPPPTATTPPPVPLEAIPLLTNGQHAGPLAGAAGEGFTFRFAVPPGATRLRVALEGGQGDCDLYVHYGLPPLPQRFTDLASRTGPAPAAVSEILDPAEGMWFVRVHGKTAFKDLTLTVACEPATLPAAPPPPPARPDAPR
ncbi:MAG: pre-peptidase C-terminal domain-containing protein [Planctomycetota bacterium]|nr:pre-peptidase C-terminal domain-containing protein [Planctomycetota bacterium]